MYARICDCRRGVLYTGKGTRLVPGSKQSGVCAWGSWVMCASSGRESG